jgi:hypothetical protein
VPVLPPDPVADANLALNHLKDLTFARRASDRLGLNENPVAGPSRHGLGLSLYGVGGNPMAHLPSDTGQLGPCELPGDSDEDEEQTERFRQRLTGDCGWREKHNGGHKWVIGG